MGGTHSQITKNVTNSISTAIVNSLQDTQIDTNINQVLNARCDKNFIESMAKSVTDNVLSYYGKISPDRIKDINKTNTSLCSVNNVNMNYTINLSSAIQQLNKDNTKISNNIKNTLSQLLDGSDSNQTINNSVNTITNSLSDLRQILSSNQNISQIIDVSDYQTERISISSTIDIINKFLMNNKSTASIINNIAVDLSQISINKNNILTIFLSIIGILFLLYFLITITMKLKNSDDLHSFFVSILPYFIIIILSLLIIAPQIALKPNYISYKDFSKTKDVKNLSIPKTIGFSLLYIFIISLIVFITFYFINRNKTKTKYIKIN